MPTDFTQPGSIGRDDLQEVAYLPHHVRGLQNEVMAVVDECLQELDTVCEMLWTVQNPSVTEMPDLRDLAGVGEFNREPDRPAGAPLPPIAPTYAKTESLTDFDARLANLKRLLAEKLTESDRSTGQTTSNENFPTE